MKKVFAIVLAALMFCTVLPLNVFAADGSKNAAQPAWTDYFTSVEVLDLDKAVIKGHTGEDGKYVVDEWYMPHQYRFTLKDGSKKDVEIDISKMKDAEEEVDFVVNAAPGVDLTMTAFQMDYSSINGYIFGIYQDVGEEFPLEVFSIYVDLDPQENENLSLWGRIVAFFKKIFETIKMYFILLTL